MRKTIYLSLLFLIAGVPTACMAVGTPVYDTASVRLSASCEYGYNYAMSNYGSAAFSARWRVASNVALEGGYRFCSRKIHSFVAGTTIYFPYKRVAFAVENRYLWQLFDASNIQEMNAMLALGLDFGSRATLRVGIFNKFYTTIHHPNNNADYILEPLNLAYMFEGWALNPQKRFNIGLRLCNVDDFTMERFYSPLVYLKLRYRINGQWCVYANARTRNSGIFDLNSNHFDSSFQLGIETRW